MTYVRDHPVDRWEKPTYILYAENEELIAYPIIAVFVKRFHCYLTIMQNGEQWFHTPEQLEGLDA